MRMLFDFNLQLYDILYNPNMSIVNEIGNKTKDY